MFWLSILTSYQSPQLSVDNNRRTETRFYTCVLKILTMNRWRWSRNAISQIDFFFLNTENRIGFPWNVRCNSDSVFKIKSSCLSRNVRFWIMEMKITFQTWFYRFLNYFATSIIQKLINHRTIKIYNFLNLF